MIVLIDGASGAGKTTLARTLAGITGFGLVHLDDFYPGWYGLEAASRMVVDDVLACRRFRRWDWQLQQPGAWEQVPEGSLIVEGTGALTRASLRAASAIDDVLTIACDGPEPWRKRRALARDPGYAAWWETWARQERLHAREMPAPDVRWWRGQPVRWTGAAGTSESMGVNP